MPSSSFRTEDMKEVCFMLFLGITTLGAFTAMLNIEMYSIYLQSEIDQKTYSWLTTCNIDQIISRPQHQPESSLTFVNSTFLISYERTTGEHGNRQVFEEWSVPVPLQPNMINTSYACFVDPTNMQQRAVQFKLDVNVTYNNFFWKVVVPGLAAVPGLIVVIILGLGMSLKKIRILYARHSIAVQPESSN